MTGIVIAQMASTAVALVQRTLRDWAATGLVGPVIWIDADTRGDTLLGQRTVGANTDVVDVLSWYAGHPNEAYSACILDIWGWQGEDGLADPNHIAEWFRTGGRLPANCQPVHVLAAPSGVTSVPATAVPQWSNTIVLSSQDSALPSTQSLAITAESSDYVAHVAAALAGVMGLWTWCSGPALGAGFFGATGAWSNAAVARSFTRVIDARPLFRSVLADVSGVSTSGLPVATDRSARQMQLPQVPPDRCGQVASMVADAVLDKDSQYCRFRPPWQKAVSAPERISFWQAVRKYFSYMLEALTQMPAELARMLINKLERSVEAIGQGLVGQDSRYKVVLTEAMAARDNRIGQSLAAGALGVLHQRDPNVMPKPTDATVLWSDMFWSACGLIDGNTPQLPELARVMPRQGDDPMVITNPASIAPDPGAPPFVLPQGFDGIPSEWMISPCDPLAAALAQRAIAEAEAEASPELRPRVTALAAALSAWISARWSFAWAVGWGVAQSLFTAREAQARLVSGVGQDDPARLQEELRRSTHTFKVRTLIILVLTVLGLVAVGLVTSFGLLLLPAAIGIGAAWLVAMFISGVVSCWKQISVRFRADMANQDNVMAREDEQQQRRFEVADQVRRLADVADQSRAWVQLLGELVHNTAGFTAQTIAGDSGQVVLTGHLPLAMQVATVDYQPDVNTAVGAAHLALAFNARANLLGIGWFQRLARARIDLAGRLWGARHGLPSDQGMFDQIQQDAAQASDGPMAAVLANISSDDNRRQSTLTDQLMQWTHGAGAGFWKQSLEGARQAAGVQSLFSPTGFLADLAGDDSALPMHADLESIGQQPVNPSAPVAVGVSDVPGVTVTASPDGLASYIQALCRVIAIPPIKDLTQLKCCGGGAAGRHATGAEPAARAAKDSSDDATLSAPRVSSND